MNTRSGGIYNNFTTTLPLRPALNPGRNDLVLIHVSCGLFLDGILSSGDFLPSDLGGVGCPDDFMEDY